MSKLIISLFLVFSLNGYSQLCFDAPIIYGNNLGTPYSISTADFNNDGVKDIVVPYMNNSISIFIGQGFGYFNQPVNRLVGTNPSAADCADFNNDGKIDIVTTNLNSYNISILLGNGDGTFGSLNNYPVGHGPEGVAISDFNSDSYLDLAVTNFVDDSISILLGNGSGVFAAPFNIPVLDGPVDIECDDFNGDSLMDLVVSHQNSAAILILLGDGNGNFVSNGGYNAGGSTTYDIVLADFNSDSNIDLAYSIGNGVSMRLGNGLGSFGNSNNILSVPVSSLTASDINGDGNGDIIAGNGNIDSIIIRLGNGNGTFGAINKLYGGGNLINFIYCDDFNGDSKFDIAGTTFLNGTLNVLLSCESNSLIKGEQFYDFNLYPNPSSGSFKVSNGIIANCSAISTLGVVYNLGVKKTLDETEIDATSLPNGCYTLCFEIMREKYYKKVVLER